MNEIRSRSAAGTILGKISLRRFFFLIINRYHSVAGTILEEGFLSEFF
jgi:hypothetical protein